jgi:hypothetical protein
MPRDSRELAKRSRQLRETLDAEGLTPEDIVNLCGVTASLALLAMPPIQAQALACGHIHTLLTHLAGPG